MKRTMYLFAILCTISSFALAGKSKPIAVEQLPGNAKTFIQQHFANEEVSYAKMYSDFFSKRYKVIFTNGSKVKFDGGGNWEEVDCEFTEVPESIIPLQIKNHIKSKYKAVKVLEIDRDKRDYEVKLSNGLELKFDLQFRLIKVDR